MKKSYIWQAYMGMIGDMKNLEYHFSLMAERGWMIDKIGLFTHRYRAVEPCKKNFFVDFLPQITAFDYPDNEDAQNYRAICGESGWTFVAANKQFHVFCSDDENPAPIPIHTDNRIQARIYLKACKKYELPWFIYALFMLWFFSPLGKGIELFLSDMMLFMAIGYCFFSVGYLWTFIFMIRWYLRTGKSAKNDLPMPIVSYRLARLRINVFAAGSILFLVCVFIGVALEIIGGMPIAILFAMLMPLSAFGVGLWIRRQVDTKQRTRAGNIGLTIITLIIMEIIFLSGMGFTVHSIISTPSLPKPEALGNRPALTLKDVGITTEPNHSDTRIKGTMAVPVNYEHWETVNGGTVNTQVYRSVGRALTQWLYEHFAEEFTEQFAYRLGDFNYLQESIVVLSSDESAFWGAEKGIAFNYTNSNAVEVFLQNGKTILRITAENADMDLDTVSQAVRGLWENIN